MMFTKDNISEIIQKWIEAWNNHNLTEVLELIHDDIVFDNWDGSSVEGKNDLRRSWLPWFLNHGDFKFTVVEVFVDERTQNALFTWILNWKSNEKQFKNEPETRYGIDVLHFKDNKIIKKDTFSKTSITINSEIINLKAVK